ncbi:hypothetical protein [Haloflavibacter putidus]|uniref:hypothetical protein n=1 Tax=Haloflavibacter putidus TaxID=2576776 RepID=UPI001F44260B|nr:hypothetical protein [Haloflavibacter putidus]
MEFSNPILTYAILGICIVYIGFNISRYQHLDNNQKRRLYIIGVVFVLYVIVKFWRVLV